MTKTMSVATVLAMIGVTLTGLASPAAAHISMCPGSPGQSGLASCVAACAHLDVLPPFYAMPGNANRSERSGGVWNPMSRDCLLDLIDGHEGGGEGQDIPCWDTNCGIPCLNIPCPTVPCVPAGCGIPCLDAPCIPLGGSPPDPGDDEPDVCPSRMPSIFGPQPHWTLVCQDEVCETARVYAGECGPPDGGGPPLCTVPVVCQPPPGGVPPDPCGIVESRPLLITETGRLPEGWPGALPAAVVSWQTYTSCTGPETDSLLEFATDWETDVEAYGAWTEGCAGEGEAPDCSALEVPTADPGVTAPAFAAMVGSQPDHVAPGHYQVITMPSEGNNRPMGGCHYEAMNDAMRVMEETFYIDFDFNCWLGWQNNEGKSDDDKNADAYGVAHGWNADNFLVMAWIHDWHHNGNADTPGHFALGAERCVGPCVDWREENIAQHEMSHLLSAEHPNCHVTSIMNTCETPYAGSSPHHRHYDRQNLERVCGFTGSCTVV